MERPTEPNKKLGPNRVSDLLNALDPHFDFEKLIGHNRLGVCLDFDGTLSPIVEHPNAAALLPGNAQIVAELAALTPTAIVSGRQAAEVKSRLPHAPLYIAGSHGYEVLLPDGEIYHPLDASHYNQVFAGITEELRKRLSTVPGSIVEEKPFGISVHDRQVSKDQVELVRETVESICASHDEVLVTTGKRVSEIRPTLDWHKGHVIHWITQQWGLVPEGLVVYIGDDRTDEDAFAALGEADITILVASKAEALAENRQTWARFQLADPEQVQEWLQKLTNFLKQQTETTHGHEKR